jgi:hypothetical protein
LSSLHQATRKERATGDPDLVDSTRSQKNIENMLFKSFIKIWNNTSTYIYYLDKLVQIFLLGMIKYAQ